MHFDTGSFPQGGGTTENHPIKITGQLTFENFEPKGKLILVNFPAISSSAFYGMY